MSNKIQASNAAIIFIRFFVICTLSCFGAPKNWSSCASAYLCVILTDSGDLIQNLTDYEINLSILIKVITNCCTIFLAKPGLEVFIVAVFGVGFLTDASS